MPPDHPVVRPSPKSPGFRRLRRDFQFNLRLNDDERRMFNALSLHAQMSPAEVVRASVRAMYDRLIAAPAREEEKKQAHAAQIQEAVTAAYQALSREQVLLAEELFQDARRSIISSDISPHAKRKLLHQLDGETQFERKERLEAEEEAKARQELAELEAEAKPIRIKPRRPLHEVAVELQREKAEASWTRRISSGASARDDASGGARSPRAGKGAPAAVKASEEVAGARPRNRKPPRSR